MQKKTFLAVAIIGVVAVALAALILGTGGGSTEAVEDTAGAYPRGPHGGRLLSDDGLQVEVTIYEAGVPPVFKVYPLDPSGKPLPPRDVVLRIELHRLGGRIDRFGFKPEADYLLGDGVVEEPHSFDVKVVAEYRGRRHEWSYSQAEGKVQLGEDQLRTAGIVIERAGPRTIVTSFELPGQIKADDTRMAHVVPGLQGIVLQVMKKAGDSVRRGEVIAVLSSRELADAKSAYLAAARHVEFTRVALDREEALWKKKISAEREYLSAKRDFEEARLALQLAGQRLVALGVPAASLPLLAAAPVDRLSRLDIRAPLSGTVIERDVTVGESVAADRTLFVIGDLSSVWVDVSVYARDIASVKAGQEAAIVSADLGQETSGRISFIGPLVGEDTRAATARIVLTNRGAQWRPGLFVTVRLTRETTTLPIAVSTQALQTFRDWQVVFVRHGEWFEARPVELGRTDGTWVEVVKGLSAGEQYAAANSFAVKAEIGKLGASHDH